MNKIDKTSTSAFADNVADWQRNYKKMIGQDSVIKNRSGIEVKPLYWPREDTDGSYVAKLGFPGAYPMTRGVYPTMHRGRTWSQRQLIGLVALRISTNGSREYLNPAPVRLALFRATPSIVVLIATK